MRHRGRAADTLHPHVLDARDVGSDVVRRDDLIALKERSAADPRRRKSSAMQDRTDIERLRGDVGDPNEGW